MRFVVGLVYAITHKDFRRIRIPERYLEELEGYAAGSGVPYRVLYFLNFVLSLPTVFY